MTAKAQIMEMIDFVPENQLPSLLDIVKQFAQGNADDFVTKDDLRMHEIAIQEYKNGETTGHEDINWD